MFSLLLIMTVLMAACGGKEVKPFSPEARLAQEAFVLSETLRSAYLANDRATLEKLCTKDGYAGLSGVIKPFESAELTLTPTWVDIQDSNVSLTISWQGTWSVNRKVTEERGQAIFVLEGSPLKLARIQRANPFSQPE